MQIRCPVCEYVREVDLEKIPATAEFATCPKCKHRFRFRAVDLDAVAPEAVPVPARNERHADIWDAVDSLQERWKEQGLGGAADGRSRDDLPGGRTAIPWESPKDLGYVQSFFRTTLWVLTKPSSFFSSLSRVPKLLHALGFCVIFGIFQHVLGLVWLNLFVNTMRDEIIAQFGEEFFTRVFQESASFASLPSALISAPFVMAVQVFLASGIIHVMIRLLEPEEADFAKTFKVICYAAAGYVLTLVPMLGSFLGAVYFVALIVIGCRYAFRLSWNKAALAILPLFVLIVLFASAMAAPFAR